MFIIALISIAVIVVLFKFLSKWTWKNKGDRGEHYVSNILSSLNENEYKVLNNVMLRTKNGGTTQIDHIIVSTYGIFVIETKNYSGWIFGNENAEKWMQTIYNERHQFRNPVKQNWSHIYALKDLLTEFRNAQYFPIVVFVGIAELKDIQSKMPVIYDNQLLGLIQRNSVSRCLSENDVQKVVTMLTTQNIDSEETRAEHIKNIRQNVTERQLKMKNLICPRCNGKLKLRNGRNGKFYGCSNYPRCHFTMPY